MLSGKQRKIIDVKHMNEMKKSKRNFKKLNTKNTWLGRKRKNKEE